LRHGPDFSAPWRNVILAVQRSTDRIITTHAGSLPRSPELVAALVQKDRGFSYDESALAALVRESVFAVVRKQAEIGLDVIDDGEHSKSSFTAYLRTRLAGLGQTAQPYNNAVVETRDYLAFSEAYDEAAVMLAARPSKKDKVRRGLRNTACTGPITYVGAAEVASDAANLRDALAQVTVREGFITALSPGNLQTTYRNDYYPDEDTYLEALADALHDEYAAIVAAGFVLQIDDPRLVTHWDRTPEISLEECRRFIAAQVEVINHALRGIPEDRVRYHTCYSTNIAPRAHDLELRHYVDLMLRIRAGAYSIEAANPRHDHEWELWEQVKLPEGKILIPGVVSHCVSLVEHPELVAQRIVRYAKLVGRENVIAGTDCGFGTSAVGDEVHPEVAWAKLRALVAGARLASAALW
jgi:5-methyltetrahydropteroyltriglutamate--homocysteine methyltransferase